jgi:hypothetical protein
MRVFISYSVSDARTAGQLGKDLGTLGLSVWVDKQEIKVGDSIPYKISEGVRTSDYVILLVSRKSLESRWVEREWLPAIHREIENGQTTLLPVILEDCDLPTILSDKRYADFRDGYVAGLSDLATVFADRLVSDHSRHLGIHTGSKDNISELLESLFDCCGRTHSIRVRQLLSTLFAINDPRHQHFPEWLEGNWVSRFGWNEGDVLKCTKQAHAVCSNIAYGSAIASFRTLREGVITGALECSDGVASIKWVQEVGGTMNGAVCDQGWGFLWKHHPDNIRGLWWYENVPTDLPTSDPKSQVHRWALQRIGDSA